MAVITAGVILADDMPAIFRAVCPGDRKSILELFHAAFRAEPDALEWEWKYDRNPRPSLSVAAFDEDRAIGFFGGMGTRYAGALGNLPGTASVDVMTHPTARALGKQGLFAQLGETYKKLNSELGMPFDFGFPHERARKIEERLLGCITIERAGQLSGPVDSPALSSKKPARRLFRRVLVSEPFGRAHESLVEALHARPGWRTDRSADVVNWRFRERPGVTYRTLQLLGLSGKSRGYSVIRISNDAALLVDFQLLDEASPDLGDLLLETAQNVASEVRFLRVRLPQKSVLAKRFQEEWGFVPEESDTHLLVRPFDPGFDLATAAAAFDYRFSDHDVF